MNIGALKGHLESDAMGGCTAWSSCLVPGVRVKIFTDLDSRTLKKQGSL